MTTFRDWRRILLVVLAWAAVISWAIAIFVLSHQPGDPDEGGGRLRFGIEKAAHLFVYAVLAVGVANALTTSGMRARRFWWTFVLCAGYAVSDELHQFFVPGRSASALDIFIDMAGATAGWVAFVWLSRIEISFGIRAGARSMVRHPRLRGRTR